MTNLRSGCFMFPPHGSIRAKLSGGAEPGVWFLPAGPGMKEPWSPLHFMRTLKCRCHAPRDFVIRRFNCPREYGTRGETGGGSTRERTHETVDHHSVLPRVLRGPRYPGPAAGIPAFRQIRRPLRSGVCRRRQPGRHLRPFEGAGRDPSGRTGPEVERQRRVAHGHPRGAGTRRGHARLLPPGRFAGAPRTHPQADGAVPRARADRLGRA